ncbi:MAG TPA: TetR/AcrR family transcriptional regulator [Solirubrobacteraceae bacterium]|nr:TetR/AcrR family transcriptional regulator [Solirubrobacteraceae bacterium]
MNGRPPGRPRSAAADSAILQATLELLLDTGYRGLTMEQVRTRAGVGKATLYRRYGSKQELVADAIRHVNQEIPAPDTGTVRGDLLAAADMVLAAAARVGAATFMPRLLAESAGDREMHAIFSENLVAPRRALLATVLRRGVERGELRADLDVELAIDLVAGPWVYRLLIAGGELPETDPARMVDLLLGGLASP